MNILVYKATEKVMHGVFEQKFRELNLRSFHDLLYNLSKVFTFTAQCLFIGVSIMVVFLVEIKKIT